MKEILYLYFILFFIDNCWSDNCPVEQDNCDSSYEVSTIQVSGTMRDVWGCGYDLPPSLLPTATFYYPNNTYYNCGEITNYSNPICTQTGPTGWLCAEDFERTVGNDRGILVHYLDSDGKPILVSNYDEISETKTIRNKTQFYWWYRDTPVFNIPIPITLTLSNNGTCNSKVFQFNDQKFFKIDDRGFGTYWGKNVSGYNPGHNYGFTFEARLKFVYQGDEFFQFAGDDDVFVFINGIWALDLGGVHATEYACLNLTYPSNGCPPSLTPNQTFPCNTYNGNLPCACMLGLVPKNAYDFVLFYNERHTVSSDLKFSTSILLQCPWYDWCGVCQGNGQSCCTCKSPNACFTSYCNATNGDCITEPIQCNSTGSLCSYYQCKNSTGNCIEYNINCDDNNPCTIDSCNPETGCIHITKRCIASGCENSSCDPKSGECANKTISNCSPGCQNITCSSGCLLICHDGQCLPSNQSCSDGNPCTNDYCLSNGTCINEYMCDDNDPCTIDSCNPNIGCIHTLKNCNDNNACTNDSCSSNGTCIHTPVYIPPGNACVGIFCDKIKGIIYMPVACPKACTGCDPEKGCIGCPSGGINVGEAVGISVGSAVGIGIGAAAAIALISYSGKKGYDKWLKNHAALNNIQENPLYENNGKEGANPLYES